MANGFKCTKCGYQETEHEDRSLALNPHDVCDCFTLSEADQKEQSDIMRKNDEDAKNRPLSSHRLTPRWG